MLWPCQHWLQIPCVLVNKRVFRSLTQDDEGNTLSGKKWKGEYGGRMKSRKEQVGTSEERLLVIGWFGSLVFLRAGAEVNEQQKMELGFERLFFP